ncbi:unnamed protein product [Urochloa decumbens]|uniref:DUF1618 domain-containing protein n=1 Tax=Urochloa decumbens TaxID=240449 RepID=A0ABC9ASP9_9POAL
MKMLRHVGLGCLNGRILSISRPSIIPLSARSIHHVPSSGRRQEPSVSPLPAAAAKDPAGWMMLNSYGAIRTADTSVSDPNTIAETHTSTDRHLRVFFGRTSPPASTFVYYNLPDTKPGEEDGDELYVSVLAAHGESVLLEVSSGSEDEHFLYRVAGAARPPSLTLLPARDFLTKSEKGFVPYIHPPIQPTLHSGSTGLLRRGDGDDLLVQLQFMFDREAQQDVAELCLLRLGTPRWDLMEPVPIVYDQDFEKGDTMLWLSRGNDTALSVGERFLCLFGYERGFYLCDLADEASPKVQFVPLPPDVMNRCGDDSDDDDRKISKNMGAAGSSAVRYVSVDVHCCCGGPGRSTCVGSRYAFTINSWIMDLCSIDNEPLTWVKDGEIDCEELWALPGYEGLPRADVQCPVVSLDDPDIVCFLVSNYEFVSYEDYKVWMIQLNVKTKTLLSVVQFAKEPWRAYYHFPAKL